MKKKKGDKTTRRLSEFFHNCLFARPCFTKVMGLFDIENLLLQDFGLSFLQFILTFHEQ